MINFIWIDYSQDVIYPVMLDIEGVDVLVVGGGRVATSKARGLVSAGALVTVVAPRVDDDLREIAVQVHERCFEAPDVNGRRLIFTATGISQVDRQVFRAAENHGIWVNSADDPPQCSFILPAVLRHEPVVIAVSTSGASPALASYLRDRIGMVITPEIASVADDLAEQRARVKAQGQSTEGVDWRPVIEALLVDADLSEVVL